ncbi:MAG: hypothetical protein GY711_22820 [bacterium]|nr:hypothetical protein [bacterium]
MTLELADFELKWRGREIRGAPRMDPAAVRSLGLVIANKQAGAFRLELESVANR